MKGIREWFGENMINYGFGVIGTVSFVVLILVVYFLRLGEKNAGNSPNKTFRYLVYAFVFAWGLYTFVTFIITNPLTDSAWSILKRYAVLLSLLVIVIERTRNEEPVKVKTKWYKEAFEKAKESLVSLPSNVCSFFKRVGSLLVQGFSLLINWQIETLVVKVVALFKRKIADIIYFVSGLNAILLSIAIISPNTLIPLTHLTAGLLADVVNDILGIIAVIIAGIDASVPSEKNKKVN